MNRIFLCREAVELIVHPPVFGLQSKNQLHLIHILRQFGLIKRGMVSGA